MAVQEGHDVKRKHRASESAAARSGLQQQQRSAY